MKEHPKQLKTPSRFTRQRSLRSSLQQVSQQMYVRNKELNDTNRMLSLMRIIDSLVLESQSSLTMVCEHIAEAITQAAGYPFVGILTKTHRSNNEVVLSGWSAASVPSDIVDMVLDRPVHVEVVGQWFDDFKSSKLFNLEAISSTSVAELTGRAPRDIKTLRKHLPLKSVYVIKLHSRQELVGLLVVGLYDEPNRVTTSDIQLLDQLGESIGVALDNKLLFEENQRIVKQLQISNEKLKTLDETKDEFISMASHQLRTPLTSVKGYLSMVLEGDAGQLTDMQQKLLGQAFTSSQRMVYLIADLLNLSRLRTGKFVIDASPTNLAMVISGEIDQLREVFAAKNMQLVYDEPQDFPTLMMDETKIRQVLMNFIDNAVYYTPAGGSIVIGLKDKKDTIEFTVKDNGIGVPQNEQHHLFNKFYRAGNARKARPDGTGLGLFMAKKVIAASGGAILFSSKENKGSTFGFTFSKKKLAVPASPTPEKELIINSK